MKSVYILSGFAFVFLLLLTSCNKGGLVDKSKPKSRYYYSFLKNKIWYKHSTSPDVSQLWNYDWIKVPADAESFVILDHRFAKDKNHIFWGSNIVENVDYKTFEIDNMGVVRDKNNIYVSGLNILKDANPATYQLLKAGAVYYSEKPQYNWAKDDKNYFYKDSVVVVDYDSFKILTPNIVADNDSIFSINHNNIHKCGNKDSTTKNLKVIDSHIIHSSNYFYFRDYLNDGEIMEIPIKDSNSIKMYCKRDYFAIDGIVYFQGIAIENADFKTFETFEKGDAVWFAKDKNNVYVNTSVIADAKPQTVRYNKEANTIEDGDYIWKWSETELKTLVKVEKH